MSSHEISIFRRDGVDLRAVAIDGEPWFVTADVLSILDLDRTALRRLDDDEMGVDSIHTLGGSQSMNIVSEPGLYALILGSRKPGAKEFKRWVTHEILPSIRKTGSYVAVESPEQLLSRALVLAAETLTAKDEQILALEPRADAWDALASAEGDYSVGDAAKILARSGIPTGPTRLFAQLVTIKWTYRASDGKPRAYAERVEKGYLSEKPQFHYHPGTGARVLDAPQVRVTVKGLERLRQRLHIGALAAVAAS